MQFRHFNNAKGVTLVELLAAISLITIIISLSSILIMQVMENNEQTSERISLSQGANLIISEIRSQYTNLSNDINEGASFNLCISNVDDITITNVEMDGIKKSFEDNCIENIIKKETNSLSITINNNLNQKLLIETTLSTKATFEVPIVLIKEEDNLDNDEEDYIGGDTMEVCDFYGDTKFTQRQIGLWNSCPNPTVHDGNAWFPNNISFFQDILFTVDHNLFTDNAFNSEHNSSIYVKQGAKFKGDSVLKSNSSMRVDGSFIAQEDLTIQENADFNIGNNAEFERNLKMMGNATLNVGGNFTAKSNLNLQQSNILNVSKNAYFQDNVKLMGNAQLSIKGDAVFNNDLHFQENSRITIEGDVSVKGNISPEWGAGAMCIIGEATFNQGLYDNLKIKQNATECFRPTGYNIYYVK